MMAGFAAASGRPGGRPAGLVGPAVEDVSDDPEGRAVLGECVEPPGSLAGSTAPADPTLTLPMDDGDENAAMVNALQRHATVIVQKSLAEGFGLTVAEGMWKGRAVIASRVGGIIDQIAAGTGILLEDPADLAEFGRTLSELLAHPAEIAQLGLQARQHVLEHFVGDEHLESYAHLIEWLGP